MAIQEQIQQQRQNITQARSTIKEKQKKNLMRSARELRGIKDRDQRQSKSALTQRAERKATKELLTKSMEGVGQFEIGFEKEVAEKFPKYGKEEYVSKEYEKATATIKDKIENIENQIKEKGERIQYYRNKDDSDSINEIEDEIDILNARIKGYKKALSGDKAQVIENVNTGYAEQLADYESSRRQGNIDFRRDIRSGKLDTEIQSLQSEGLLKKGYFSMSDFNRAVKEYNKGLSQSMQSPSISVDNIPSEQLFPITEQAKVSNIGEYRNVLTGQTISAIDKPSNLYVKVNPLQDLADNRQKMSISPTKDLKKLEPSKLYGFGLSTGLSLGAISGINNVQSIRNTFSNIYSSFNKGNIQGIQKSKEISQGASISAYQPEYFSGKQVEKPETTTKEKITSLVTAPVSRAREFSEQTGILTSAESLLGVGNVGGIEGKDILGTIQLSERSKQSELSSKKIEKYDNDLSKLEKEINNIKKQNINEENLKKLNSKVNEYNQILENRNRELNKYNKFSKVNVGIQNRDVREFGFGRNMISDISASVSLPITLIAGEVGKGTKKTLEVFNFEKKIPEKKISYFEPQFGTKQYDVITGKEITGYKEVIRPSYTITPESVATKVQTGTELAGQLGKYSIPVVGGTLFGIEATGYLTEVTPKIISGEELTTSEKIEGALLGGIILGAGVLKTARYLKTPILQVGEKEALLTTKGEKLFSSRIRIGDKDRLIKFIEPEIYPKRRGLFVAREELIPTKKAIEQIFTLDRMPSKTGSIGNMEYRIFEDVKGFKRGVQTGEKAIAIKNNEILYSGLAKDRKQYKEVLGFFKEAGFEKQGIELLRRKAPKIVEEQFTGNILTLESKGKQVSFPLGFTERYAVRERVGGVLSRNVKEEASLIEGLSIPLAKRTEFKIIPSKEIKIVEETKLVSQFKGAKPEELNKLIEGGISRITTFEKGGKLSTTTPSIQFTKGISKATKVAEREFNLLRTQGKDILKLDIGEEKLLSVTPSKQFGGTELLKQNVEIYSVKSAIKEVVPLKTFESKLPISESRYTLLLKGETTPQEKITTNTIRKIKEIGQSKQIELLKTQAGKSEIEALGSILKQDNIVKSDIKIGQSNIESTIKSQKNQIIPLVSVKQKEEKVIDLAKIEIPSSIEKQKEKTSFKELKAFREISKQETKSIQQPLSLQRFNEKQLQKELQKSAQTSSLKKVSSFQLPKIQNIKQINPLERVTQRESTKKISVDKKTSSLLKNIAKKVEEEGTFEAVGIKGGKEVSILKGTKEQVAKGLSKFLKGTLSASGFLKETKTGRKLKAKETGLLGDIEFTTSKINSFKVVEKKSKRLRKSGTGKEIQAFRRTSKKRRLFGL